MTTRAKASALDADVPRTGRAADVYIEGCTPRRARKPYRCTGNGARPPDFAAGHADIKPGDAHVEFWGETPPYQAAPRVCMACAAAFYAAQ
jgi:hypothetical protein